MSCKKTVGIKYCGGCNPRFDRSKFVREVEKDYPECLIAPARAGEIYDYLLIVCGCPACCAQSRDLWDQCGRVMICKESDRVKVDLLLTGTDRTDME